MAACQMRADVEQRRSGRALDVRLREIVAFVEKRRACRFGESVSFHPARQRRSIVAAEIIEKVLVGLEPRGRSRRDAIL